MSVVHFLFSEKLVFSFSNDCFDSFQFSKLQKMGDESMSNGPTLTGQTCIEAISKQYLNVTFSKKDWCSFKGHCRVDQLLTDKDTPCFSCRYRILLDIPDLLNYEHKRIRGE